MKSVQFIQYTFGSLASEPISKKLQELYCWIARSLTKAHCIQSVSGKDMNVPSVAKTGGLGHIEIYNGCSAQKKAYFL